MIMKVNCFFDENMINLRVLLFLAVKVFFL
jgi:hypothetical protein